MSIETPEEWALAEKNVTALIGEESDSPQWFALRVRSGSEKMVAAIAENKGVENFLPVYQCSRRWSDRVKSLELPLFPGYLFCRLNPKYRLPVLTIPGVQHFVGIGRAPVAIDEAEIAAIQTAVRSGLHTEPWPYLSTGQRVRLDRGPLEGLEGLLVEVRKQQRIVVSVQLLMRSVAVEIERGWVTPAGANGGANRGKNAPATSGGWRLLAPLGEAGLG
ncbi:MAG TPA: UpxY family transcription antiterminator [Bryobacteraceae bacterium]|nr:UpxY family transcription antiterminator [Bryobacteraceae bacterium]